jgi:hypothetical protein
MLMKSIALLFAVVSAATAAVQPPQAVRSAKVGAMAIVGQWIEEVDAGEPVVRVDGVPGQPPPAAAVEKAATALFGKVDPVFVANATAPGAFSLAVLPGVSAFSAGTFRARFRLVSGASDQTAGLVFDLRPNGEYLYARYNTKDGNIALWRYAKGAREVIAHGEQHVQLPLGAWHEIAVTIAGTRLVAVVNDTLRFEHQLPQPVDGRVGFWTKRDSVTMFKDVRVTARPK